MATAEKKNGSPAERPIDRIKAALAETTSLIESLLPAELKGRAEWFTNRAMLTFARGSQKLQQCSVGSFVQCVVNGAEIGIPIDAKLGHAVPYNNNKKVGGRDNWVMEAQFQPSYIALKVIAKRSGQIVDAYAKVIRDNDNFTHGTAGDNCHLEHNWDIRKDRGPVIGAYAVVILPSRYWRYEIMDISELDAIKARSKSKDRDGHITGPWVTDESEMQKKTVLKRTLKTDCSDPGFIMATQYDDAEYEHNGEIYTPRGNRRHSRSPLNEQLGLPSPKAPTQFERDFSDMVDNTVVDERETVEAPRSQAEAETFKHAEPEQIDEPTGEQNQDSKKTEWDESVEQFNDPLTMLSIKLEDATDEPAVRAARKWFRNEPTNDDALKLCDEMCAVRKKELVGGAGTKTQKQIGD
jgi:phage RecT family recombinase